MIQFKHTQTGEIATFPDSCLEQDFKYATGYTLSQEQNVAWWQTKNETIWERFIPEDIDSPLPTSASSSTIEPEAA